MANVLMVLLTLFIFVPAGVLISAVTVAFINAEFGIDILRRFRKKEDE